VILTWELLALPFYDLPWMFLSLIGFAKQSKRNFPTNSAPCILLSFLCTGTEVVLKKEEMYGTRRNHLKKTLLLLDLEKQKRKL
jgi:hypothetical protein